LRPIWFAYVLRAAGEYAGAQPTPANAMPVRTDTLPPFAPAADTKKRPDIAVRPFMRNFVRASSIRVVVLGMELEHHLQRVVLVDWRG
jgi:hypothetical protein